jgi:hypothetical protein
LYCEESFDFIPVIYISFYITDVVVEVISSIGDILHFSNVTEIVQIKTKRGLSLDVIFKELVDLIKKDCENYNILKDTPIDLHIIWMKAVEDAFSVYDLNEPSVSYGVDIVRTFVGHIKTEFNVEKTLMYLTEF